MTALTAREDTPAAPRPGEGRERILLAALDEFATRGFDGASTTAIARRCGVTQPLIHYHFGSKEGLWRATVDELFHRLGKEFVAPFPRQLAAGPDVRQTLLAVAAEFVRFCGRYPQFARLLYLELPLDTSRKAWLMDTWIAPMAERIRAAFPSLSRAAGLKPVAVGHFMAALTGAATTFFTLGDFMVEAYGIDARDPAAVEAHAMLLVALLDTGLFEAKTG